MKKRSTYLKISITITALIFAAALVGLAFLKSPEYAEYSDLIFKLMAMLLIPLVALVVFGFVFNRCHKCGRYLQRVPLDATNCPFCGKEFDEK